MVAEEIEIVGKAPPKKVKGLQVSRIKELRADSRKNLKIVSRLLVKDPDMTTAEIKRQTGLSETAINRAKKNMAIYLDKDESIVLLTEKDMNIVKMGQEEIERRISDPEQLAKIKTTDLANILEKSEKRYMLFRGEMTNQDGGLKRIDSIEIV